MKTVILSTDAIGELVRLVANARDAGDLHPDLAAELIAALEDA